MILSSESVNIQSDDRLIISDEFSIDELDNQVTLHQEEFIQPEPSTEIITSLLDNSIINGDLSMSPQANDLHKTPVLKILIQCDDKCGQVMTGISIPTMLKETITQTKFKIILQPQPYMFSWINQISIDNFGCDVLKAITKGCDFEMKDQSLPITLIKIEETIESLVVDLPADLPLLSTFKSAFPDEVPEKPQDLCNILYTSILFPGDTLFKLPQFWDTLWHKKGTLRGFMSACHPQMDGHAPVLDRSIDSQLVKEPPDTWDLTLPQTKLVYNDSVNRSTGLSPHEFLYDHKPRVPLDLMHMSPLKCASESTKAFAYCMSELHKSISDQINLSNSRYK